MRPRDGRFVASRYGYGRKDKKMKHKGIWISAATAAALAAAGLALPANAAGWGFGNGGGSGMGASSGAQYGYGDGSGTCMDGDEVTPNNNMMRNGDGATSGRNLGNRQGNRQGMRGNGMPRGGMMGTYGSATAAGTLTATQKTWLQSMANEEKLAFDVYTAFAAKYPEATVFGNIAAAEARHLAAVRNLLTKYNVGDPTKNLVAGDFSTSAFDSLYDKLIAKGATLTGAYEAGVDIEELDIADLKSGSAAITATDVQRVVKMLTSASQNHLAAFNNHLAA